MVTASSSPAVRRCQRVDAAQHARSARARPSRPRSPRRCATPNTRPSSSEFDARRLAPCTPVHAASPHAQSPASVVAPSRSVHDAAGQVVRGGRDRQPVAGRVEADGAAPPPDRREAVGEVVDRRWRRATGGRGRARCSRRVIARGDDVAGREVGERVLVGHERDAVARRAGSRPRRAAPRRAAAAASTGGAARWGGTA